MNHSIFLLLAILFTCPILSAQSPYVTCSGVDDFSLALASARGEFSVCEQRKVKHLDSLLREHDVETFCNEWFDLYLNKQISSAFRKRLQEYISCELSESEVFIDSCVNLLYVQNTRMTHFSGVRSVYPIMEIVSHHQSIRSEVSLRLANSKLNDCEYMSSFFSEATEQTAINIIMFSDSEGELFRNALLTFLYQSFSEETLSKLITNPCVIKKLNL